MLGKQKKSPLAGDDTLRALARLLASREPLAVLLDKLLRFVEQFTKDMRCSVLLADVSTGVLHSGEAPSLPRDYTRAIDGLPIADGVGSCGTAAARRTTVVVSDISTSPLWRNYTNLAKSHGLAACWSVPLLDSGGELLGTCAMYYSQPRVPTAKEEDWIRIAVAVASMIIQRHRDLERLHASEARYRQLAETCPDAVIVHLDGCIAYANRAAAELLHAPVQEITEGQGLQQLVSPECRRDVFEHRTGRLSASLRRSDGASVPVEISASQVLMHGRPMTLLICRDVTERITLEQELLYVASREQTHLAYDLHDGLGQELAGIALFLRGLANEVVRELPAYAEDFERVNSMVSKSIEETRRLASGMSSIAVERAGLAGALTALAAQARDLYGLQVELEIDPLSRVTLDGSIASHLYRIVQEATNNVARHARATLLRITAKVTDSELCLTVADDGIGVPEPPKAGERTGGLGLRIMQYRAREVGGAFRIDRRSPHGTIIRVSCPLKERARTGA